MPDRQEPMAHHRERLGVLASAWRGATLGVVVGLLAFSADAASIASWDVGSPTGSLLLGTLGLLVVCGGALGALSGGLAALSVTVTERLERVPAPAWTREGAVAAAIALPAVVQLSRKIFSGKGLAHSALSSSGPWLVLGGGLLGAAVAAVALRFVHARLARRGLGWRLVALAVTIVFAAACVMAERTQHIDAYFYLHVTALLVGALSLLLGLDLVVPRRRVLSGALALVLLVSGVLLTVAAPGRSNAERLFLYERPLFASIVTSGVRASWDRDGDGYSPLLGGGDCDDSDREVNPLALDAPGDAVDADCDGEDGPALTAQPTPPVSCGSHAEPALLDAKRRLARANLVVVVVDALRADRLDPTAPTAMPRLSRFAAGGVQFRHAFAPAASTSYCVPALLSGLERLPKGAPTLVERLREGGYHTGAVVLDDVVRVMGDLLDRFERVTAVPTEREAVSVGSGVTRYTGDDVTNHALKWVDERPADQPFALVVHYMAGHQWYRIKDPELDAAGAKGGMAARYDVVMGWLDGSIGRLLDELERRGLTDDTLVVIVADHGEGLGDRGVMTHGRLLYPELTHVPLVLRGPGLRARAVDPVVGLVDLAPTIADLLGLSKLPATNGKSLAALSFADDPTPGCTGPYFMSELNQVGVLARGLLLLHMPSQNTFELVEVRPGALDRIGMDVRAQMLGWLQYHAAGFRLDMTRPRSSAL